MELDEQASLILDGLDELEARLLEYDEAIRKGEDARALVHVIFRKAHNLKGALGVAGREGAARLVHSAESCLDALRSTGIEPGRGLTDLLIAMVDALRRELARDLADGSGGSGGDPDLEAELGEAAMKLKSAAKGERSIGFALDAAELARLEAALSPEAGEGDPEERPGLWLVEKLVAARLDKEAIVGLPVFDTIARVGSLVAWRLRTTEEGGAIGGAIGGATGGTLGEANDGAEAVLEILFATALTAEDLSFEIFDPLFQIATPATGKPPEARTGEARPGPGSGGKAAVQEPEARNASGRPSPGASRAAPRSMSLPRILVVDDEALALLLLQKALVAYGRIDTAGGGREAIERFGEALGAAPYDVVFLDIMMEDFDGTEVLHEIRRLEREAGLRDGEGARVVMSSALSDFGTVSLAFREQCEAYLIKPVDPAKVAEAMGKLGFAPLH